MSKIQFHAYALAVILGLAIVGAKSAKPVMIQGRPQTDFSRVPMELAGWSGRNEGFDEATYKSLPSCSLLLRYYEHPEYSPVELAVVYGTDLGDFHQPEVCLEGQGLRSVEKGKVRIATGGGTSFEAISLIMESDYGRRAYVFWFASDKATGTFIGNYKLRIFLDRLFARKIEPSAMVRLSTGVYNTDEEAVSRLVGFARLVVPYLKEEFAVSSS